MCACWCAGRGRTPAVYIYVCVHTRDRRNPKKSIRAAAGPEGRGLCLLPPKNGRREASVWWGGGNLPPSSFLVWPQPLTTRCEIRPTYRLDAWRPSHSPHRARGGDTRLKPSEMPMCVRTAMCPGRDGAVRRRLTTFITSISIYLSPCLSFSFPVGSSRVDPGSCVSFPTL